jgi:hypothetical protein
VLVGDNAFQGVSHLSQDRARARVDDLSNPQFCADLVLTSLDNGADGFMFSVNDNMLSILKSLKEKRTNQELILHAIVPSAVDYVRASGQKGMAGLAKGFATQMITSGNMGSALSALKGLTMTDIQSLLRSLLSSEMSAITSIVGNHASFGSVLLHELLTDMGLALNLKWLFTSYLDLMAKKKVKAGFETRNFPFFLKKFNEWNLDVNDLFIVAPFNKVGFQMNPSKEECELAIRTLPVPNLMAINILASGYLTLREAAGYIKSLPNVGGVAVGISKEVHALETFSVLKSEL